MKFQILSGPFCLQKWLLLIIYVIILPLFQHTDTRTVGRLHGAELCVRDQLLQRLEPLGPGALQSVKQLEQTSYQLVFFLSLLAMLQIQSPTFKESQDYSRKLTLASLEQKCFR